MQVTIRERGGEEGKQEVGKEGKEEVGKEGKEEVGLTSSLLMEGSSCATCEPRWRRREELAAARASLSLSEALLHPDLQSGGHV